MSPDTLARLHAMLATPIETVADAGAIQFIEAAFDDCIKSLDLGESGDDTKRAIGEVAKRFFMLGRLSCSLLAHAVNALRVRQPLHNPSPKPYPTGCLARLGLTP